MSVELMPFEMQHLEQVDLGKYDIAFLKTHGSDAGGLEQWIGKAETIVVDGQPQGIVGIGVEDSVAYPWLLLSNSMRRRHPFALHRHAIDCINGLMKRDDVSQVWAVVYDDFAVGCRWLERLGFRLVEENFGLRRYCYG